MVPLKYRREIGAMETTERLKRSHCKKLQRGVGRLKRRVSTNLVEIAIKESGFGFGLSAPARKLQFHFRPPKGILSLIWITGDDYRIREEGYKYPRQLNTGIQFPPGNSRSIDSRC
jgi:hypothetical protein